MSIREREAKAARTAELVAGKPTTKAARVSIVVPVFDAETTLSQTIASIRMQRLEEWELLLFDDGSSDGSLEIAVAAQEEDPERTRVYRHPQGANEGQAFTTNVGVELASAPLVAPLDADDLWSSEMLSELVPLLEKYEDVALAWGPAEYFRVGAPRNKGKTEYFSVTRDVYQRLGLDEVVAFSQPTGLPEETRIYDGPTMARRFLRRYPYNPTTGSAVMRRSFYREVGGYEAELTRGHDLCFWMKVSARHRVIYHPKTLHHYRQHFESGTARLERAGQIAETDLPYQRWMVGFVDRHPAFAGYRQPTEARYHRSLHTWAEEVGWFQGRLRITRGLSFYTPLLRRRLWALLLDWVLPLRFSRRVAARLSPNRFPPLDDPLAGSELADLDTGTPTRNP
jgi:glycosyltransferase involved in cell wall biosynthesis